MSLSDFKTDKPVIFEKAGFLSVMFLVVKIVIYDPELVVSEVLSVIWLLYPDTLKSVLWKSKIENFQKKNFTKIFLKTKKII